MGQLRARVGGQWVDIGNDGPSPLQPFGVIAKATMVSGTVIPAINTTVAVSQPLNVTMLAGRRYRLTLFLRATRVAAQTSVSIRNGSAAGTSITDSFYTSQGGFDALVAPLLFDGDGVARTIVACVNPSQANIEFYPDGSSYFIVEDIGPNLSSPLGSVAVPVSPSQPLGIVAMGALTGVAGQAVAAAASYDVTVPLTFTAQIGRRYRLVCRLRAISGAGGYCYLRTSGGPIGNNDVYRWLTGSYDELNTEAIFDGNGQVGTYKVTITAGVALNVWTDQSSVGHFYIEDVGPNMTPAAPVLETPPAWNALSLGGPWSNVGGTSQPAQYRKIGDIVQLRGVIRFTVGGGNPMSVLPAGFRPATTNDFPLSVRSGSSPIFARIDPDGSIGIQGLGANTDFSFGTIFFSTTA